MAEDLASILREREQYRMHRLQRMSNMTAEQLSSHREQQRIRQAWRRQHMTDAQRANEREKQRIRRQNMSDGQKSAERERQRASYRVHTAQAAQQDLTSNKTDASDARPDRERQRNMSDAYRSAERERQCIRRRNMSDAQRAAERERHRKRRQNMSDAQRSAEKERQRIRYRERTMQASTQQVSILTPSSNPLSGNSSGISNGDDAISHTEHHAQSEVLRLIGHEDHVNLSTSGGSIHVSVGDGHGDPDFQDQYRVLRDEDCDEDDFDVKRDANNASSDVDQSKTLIDRQERLHEKHLELEAFSEGCKTSETPTDQIKTLIDRQERLDGKHLELEAFSEGCKTSESPTDQNKTLIDRQERLDEKHLELEAFSEGCKTSETPTGQIRTLIDRQESLDEKHSELEAFSEGRETSETPTDQIRTLIDRQERFDEKHSELETFSEGGKTSETPTDQIRTLIDRQERLDEKHSELEAFSEGCKASETPTDGNVSIVAEDWSGTYKRVSQADDIRFNILGISSYRANQRQKEEFSLTAYSTNAYVAVGPLGKQVLEGEKPITLEICTGEQTSGDGPKSVNRSLEMKLDELCKELASSHGGIVPHAVLSTQQISILCASRPTSMTELENLIGRFKSDKYGSRIIELLQRDIGGEEHPSKVKDAENGASKWRRKKAGAEGGVTSRLQLVSDKKMVVSRKRRVSVDIAGGGAQGEGVIVQDEQATEKGTGKQPMVEMQSSKWKSVFSTIRTMTKLTDCEKTTQLEGEGGI